MSWRQNNLWRWSAALAVGFAITVAGGYVYKFIIESTTDNSYTIHWLETVPLITIFIGFMLQREWNKANSADEEE